MIEVEVSFADDGREQLVTFAVMPRIGEIVLVSFEHEIVPRLWRVDKVLHKIFDAIPPAVTIHLLPE